jgi:tRNA (guanine37-N1)-methyltransferase
MTFHAQILTLYPEMFPGPLGVSLAGRALAEGKWSCSPIQIRDFARDKHRTVDDTPAGGGAGMVLRADVLAAAVEFALAEMVSKNRFPELVEEPSFLPSPTEEKYGPSTSSGKRDFGPSAITPIFALTPRGTPISQARIREIAQGPGITLLCGRFEGFDERLFDAYPQIEQVSVGDVVLSGGEPAALMILDACIRLLPGVMGASRSGVEESFENGLLEYPQYTRPAEWEGRMIPQVLRSGDHAKIEAWRKSQSEIDTRLRRPDLWERHIGTRVQPAYDARRKNKD